MKYFQSNQKCLGCVKFLKLFGDADLSVLLKFLIFLHILTPENTVSYMSNFFSLHLLTRDIFEADNYSPIPVANEEEYRIVISKFPFQDPELDKVRETFMLLKFVEI